MTKEQLIKNVSDELLQRPCQELQELQTTLQLTSTRAFHKVWRTIQSDETVYWAELTHRLQQVSRSDR